MCPSHCCCAEQPSQWQAGPTDSDTMTHFVSCKSKLIKLKTNHITHLKFCFSLGNWTLQCSAQYSHKKVIPSVELELSRIRLYLEEQEKDNLLFNLKQYEYYNNCQGAKVEQ